MTAPPKFGDAIPTNGKRLPWLPGDVWDQVRATLFCGEVQEAGDDTNPDMSDWEWSDIESIQLPVPRYDFVYLALERGMVPWFATEENEPPADFDSSKPVLLSCGDLWDADRRNWSINVGSARRIIGYTRKTTSTALPLAHPAAPQGEEVTCKICGGYGEYLEGAKSRVCACDTFTDHSELRCRIQDALQAELGDVYDCTRVWSAWSYGTMGEDDFTPVLDRMDDLIDTICRYLAQPALAHTARPDAGDEDVERVARAMVVPLGHDPAKDWSRVYVGNGFEEDGSLKRLCVDLARAALAAMRAGVSSTKNGREIMDPNKLIKLAARCEIATGADRELDADIALALGIVIEREGNTFYGHRDYSVMVLERDYYDHGGNPPELPAYTTSLDASASLVPHGHEWLRKSPGMMSVYREQGTGKEWATHYDGCSRSAARALVAACLRSRAAALRPT